MLNNRIMELKDTIKKAILLEVINKEELDEKYIYDLIDSFLLKIDVEEEISVKEKINLRKAIFDSLKRYDILQEILDDNDINEIMINSPTEIFIEKKGKYIKWNKKFESKEQLENIIQQIVGKINRVVNTSNPIVDARLLDGSRVHIVLPPIALKGPTVTIRKFPMTISMEKLIELKSITKEAAAFLEELVKAGYNIFISGGTGSGKTTFLNALTSFIPKDERIITIEDSAELKITHIENLVSMETRNANADGTGAIDMSTLIKASLRMNPSRIIVGEVRGKESLDMLQAMNTGHDGSISTGHANSSEDMLSRLETMVLMAQNLPLNAIRKQIVSAIDIIIHLTRDKKGRRIVQEISELGELKDGDYQIRKIYTIKEDHFERVSELVDRRKWEARL
ncbi:MAG: CpaF family protein [Eubacteriales bacterium]|nr:CpaF family protein [Eubacteriales bacterium]